MDLSERVMICKEDSEELNNLITEYKPFVAKVVQKQVNRFVEYGRDDELSVGLIAFGEAVKSYNVDKGHFLSFAEGVIKRRLIDYYRKESKHSNVVSINTYYNDDDDEKEVDITEEKSIESYNYSQEREYRQYEIADIQKELTKWGISFAELPAVSPKHAETKKSYRSIIEAVQNNETLLNSIKVKKVFPVSEIEKTTGIPKKTIERARKYAIAMIIILTGEYKYVQSFINWR